MTGPALMLLGAAVAVVPVRPAQLVRLRRLGTGRAVRRWPGLTSWRRYASRVLRRGGGIPAAAGAGTALGLAIGGPAVALAGGLAAGVTDWTLRRRLVARRGHQVLGQI